jgi:hypothetical protein
MRWFAPTQMVLALLLATGCNGERAALLRGQAYYEDNQYERALALWRSLERRESQLRPGDFARYAYLRGMTDYRLGFHADARHWLALAKVTEQQRPGGLDRAWLPRLDGALADLERETSGTPAGNVDSVQSIEAPVSETPAVEPPVAPPADELPAAPAPAAEPSLPPAPAPLPSPLE